VFLGLKIADVIQLEVATRHLMLWVVLYVLLDVGTSIK